MVLIEEMCQLLIEKKTFLSLKILKLGNHVLQTRQPFSRGLYFTWGGGETKKLGKRKLRCVRKNIIVLFMYSLLCKLISEQQEKKYDFQKLEGRGVE